MARFNIFLALVFCLFIAVFASANSRLVEINYFYGVVEISAVLVILGSAVLGASVVFIFGLYKNIKVKLQLRALNQEIKNLQEKLIITVKERDTFLAQVGRLQEVSAAREQEGQGGPKEAGMMMADGAESCFFSKNAGWGKNQQQAEEENEC